MLPLKVESRYPLRQSSDNMAHSYFDMIGWPGWRIIMHNIPGVNFVLGLEVVRVRSIPMPFSVTRTDLSSVSCSQ
jgi:hypothetical protein